MKTKKVNALSEQELEKILGGFTFTAGNSLDGVDCTSEVACGGTTTDTDQAGIASQEHVLNSVVAG